MKSIFFYLKIPPEEIDLILKQKEEERIKQEEEEELALNQSNKSIQDMNDEM